MHRCSGSSCKQIRTHTTFAIDVHLGEALTTRGLGFPPFRREDEEEREAGEATEGRNGWVGWVDVVVDFEKDLVETISLLGLLVCFVPKML